MNVAQETLGFRRQGLSPCLSLLMSAFALPIPPADLSIHLHRRRERSSTTPSDSSNPLHAKARATTHREEQLAMHKMNLSESLEIRSFGYRLEPRYIFRAGRLDQ